MIRQYRAANLLAAVAFMGGLLWLVPQGHAQSGAGAIQGTA